jgi:cytochrome c556
MTMTVQPRHAKLGLAVREGNWPYAAYELHELQQALDRATEAWPKWRDFSIAEMMPAVTKEAMAALDQATKASDPSRVTAAYEQLTAACNTCHRSADRGVIVIQSPTSSSFPDRDFRPVKQ